MREVVETYEQEDPTSISNTDDIKPSGPNLRIVKDEVKTNVNLAKDRLSELKAPTPIPVVLQETQKHRDTVVKNLGKNTQELEEYKVILEQEEKKNLPLRLLSTQRFKAKKFIPLLEESAHAQARLKRQLEDEENQMKSDLINVEKEKEEGVYEDIKNTVENVLNDYHSLYIYLVHESIVTEYKDRDIFNKVCELIIRGEMGRTLRRFSDEIENGEYFPEQKEKVKDILEKALEYKFFKNSNFRISSHKDPLIEEPYIKKLVTGYSNENFINVLNTIKEHPQFQNILGKDVLSNFEEKVERIAFQELLATERTDSKDDYINILMELKNKENIPHTIMGLWYGQEGFKNSYFKASNIPAVKTDGYEFISSLTTDELESLENRNIPGLMEIIEIVKTNKNAHLDKKEILVENQGLVTNTLYAEVQNNLAKMACHFLNNGQESEKLFSWNFLKDLDHVQLETIVDVLEQKLLNNSSKEEKAETFKFLFHNISNTTDISTLPTNLQNFALEYNEIKKIYPDFKYQMLDEKNKKPLSLRNLFIPSASI